MLRRVLAVLAGYVTWTALWLGGNAVFFAGIATVVDAGTPYTAVGPLAGLVLQSVVCSIAAGLVTAAIARQATREPTRTSVLIMAVLLLLTGVGVQIGVWPLMPLWYHLTFLGLIVPACIAGSRLIGRAERA